MSNYKLFQMADRAKDQATMIQNLQNELKELRKSNEEKSLNKLDHETLVESAARRINLQTGAQSFLKICLTISNEVKDLIRESKFFCKISILRGITNLNFPFKTCIQFNTTMCEKTPFHEDIVRQGNAKLKKIHACQICYLCLQILLPHPAINCKLLNMLDQEQEPENKEPSNEETQETKK